MSAVLKCDLDDEDRELDFELDYQLSLSVEERFRMMFQKSKEIAEMLIKNGHRKPVEIIKRSFFASLDDLIKMKEAAGRERDREDLKMLRRLKERQK